MNEMDRLSRLGNIPGLLKKFLETGIQGKIILRIDKSDNTIRQFYVNALAAEIIGQSQESLLDTDPGDYLHPADDESARSQIMTKVIKGESIELHLRMTSASNQKKLVVVKSELFYENDTEAFVYCLITDITEQMRMIESLKNSEQNQRDISDGLPIIIFVLDNVGKVVFANKCALKTTGYDSGIIGKINIRRLLDQPSFLKLLETRNELDLGIESGFKQYFLKNKSGELVPVDGLSKFITIGTRKLFLGAALDISERLKAEEEQQKLQLKMQQSQKLESLGILAGGLAHDFNNILTGLIGSIAMIQKLLAPEEKVRKYLQLMEDAANRASDLASQMLAYSGRGNFIIESMVLNDLIKDMLSLIQSSISKKANLKMNLNPNLPRILADLTQMRQIILNLIINASEALGNDEGQISVATSVIEVDKDYHHIFLGEALPFGRYVKFEVSDNGCGMDNDTKSKIFDPFFTTKFTGRGLGMAAVLGIVRSHKGSIDVYTEPKKGTRIRILLPVAEDCKIRCSKPETETSYAQILDKRTLLVIDDDAAIRESLTDYFKSYGCDVLEADNGAVGLQTFQENPLLIDLIILDITMPKMDGKEVLIAIKKINPLAKIILMSGYAESDVLKNFRKGDYTAFLQKPFNFKDILVQAIKALKVR